MSLPLAIIAVLAHFEPVFTRATWRKALVLCMGTLLARGRRTVAVALRFTGHTQDPASPASITSMRALTGRHG